MDSLIAYCGFNCKDCDARIATVNNDSALRETTAKLWAELNNAPITADMINCMGCRADGVKYPFCDGMCQIRTCGSSKGVQTCAECANMDDCKKLEPIKAFSQKAWDALKALQTEENK